MIRTLKASLQIGENGTFHITAQSLDQWERFEEREKETPLVAEVPLTKEISPNG
jgi:hypothetical protein